MPSFTLTLASHRIEYDGSLWTYDGMPQQDVKTADIDVYNDINMEVQKEAKRLIQLAEIEEARRIAIRNAAVAERQRLLQERSEAFRTLVTPYIRPGYTYEYTPDSVTINKGAVNNTVTKIYDVPARHHLNWSYRKDNRIRKIGSLASAMRHAYIEIDAAENILSIRNRANAITAERFALLTPLLEGLQVENTVRSNGVYTGTGRRHTVNLNYESWNSAVVSKTIKPMEAYTTVRVRGLINDYAVANHGLVNQVSIVGKFTIAKFKQLVDFVATLDLERSNDRDLY